MKVSRTLWRDYRQLIEESPSQLPAETTGAFQAALGRWQEITETHFVTPQVFSPSLQRHGGIWLYRRLAR